ncbi:hypothetical protein L1D34_26710 [Vibrio mediterranei]|uniref:lyase family protein n=1 Tax=Vibrio mediterranei TaxID=689 RepID=UPI001EFC8D2E|nr:lyase family protein [Vibrio mediterranei]MCG9628412.1 hypothetical protein [Vibrio mediterranei]
MAIFYDPTSRKLPRGEFDGIYEEKKLYQVWLDVEAALVQAQIEMDIVPKSEGETIIQNCKIELLNQDNIVAGFVRTGHGLIPLLDELSRVVGDDAAKYVHYGITTQNVQQTSELIVCKKFTAEFERLIESIVFHIQSLTERFGDQVVAARTHSKQALPITLSTKFAAWKDEFERCLDLLETSKNRIFQVMMGGAVGGFHTLPEKGLEMQARVSNLLEMEPMKVPSRAIRTHLCEYVNNLTIIGMACAKIAEEIYVLSSEEYGEMSEGFKKGMVGSSTMPQKVNPRLCYGIIGNAKSLFSLPSTMLNISVRPFEADGCSNLVIDQTLREANLLTHEILLRSECLLDGLQVLVPNLERNLALSQGTIVSENLMMVLSRTGLGKQKAHHLVYELVLEAKEKGTTLLEAALENDEVSSVLSPEQLKEALEPRSYTGIQFS